MELYILGKMLAYIASFFAIFLLVDFLRRKGNAGDSTKQEKSDTLSEIDILPALKQRGFSGG